MGENAALIGGEMKYVTLIGDNEYLVDIIDESHVAVDGVIYEVNFDSVSDQPVYSLLVDGKSYESFVYHSEEGLQVLLHGKLYPANVEDERDKRLRAALGGKVTQRGDYHLKAPMPGLVIAIPVSDGQVVAEGDVLLILESMKMQNELRSPRDGKISRIRVQEGDSVEQRETLLSVV
jgi:biotin carboxyl carrier protein